MCVTHLTFQMRVAHYGVIGDLNLFKTINMHVISMKYLTGKKYTYIWNIHMKYLSEIRFNTVTNHILYDLYIVLLINFKMKWSLIENNTDKAI